MTSRKRAETNRQNAQKSTGPRSPEGKARSSANALKHGLSAKQVVLPDEDWNKFEALRQSIFFELMPEGTLEEFYAEQISTCMWRLRRVYPIEVGILGRGQKIEEFRVIEGRREWLDKQLRDDDIDQKDYDEIMYTLEVEERVLRSELGDISSDFISDAANSNAISKLSRYETAIQRTLKQARLELEELQCAHKEEQQNEVEADDLGVTKPAVRHRTRSRTIN
jgi:hypothetical protein